MPEPEREPTAEELLNQVKPDRVMARTQLVLYGGRSEFVLESYDEVIEKLGEAEEVHDAVEFQSWAEYPKLDPPRTEYYRLRVIKATVLEVVEFTDAMNAARGKELDAQEREREEAVRWAKEHGIPPGMSIMRMPGDEGGGTES